uniref:Uncharacterized protein n=1 Tax=Opuntia streptacantha TaxID=393608 RepID=A0A7C9EE01_OPUST
MLLDLKMEILRCNGLVVLQQRLHLAKYFVWKKMMGQLLLTFSRKKILLHSMMRWLISGNKLEAMRIYQIPLVVPQWKFTITTESFQSSAYLKLLWVCSLALLQTSLKHVAQHLHPNQTYVLM